MTALTIRKAKQSDWRAIWSIIGKAFSDGETYAYSPEITEAEAHRVWMEVSLTAYVAVEDGTIAGTYYLKSNQPGLGAHVCNCGYIVAESARGKGVASLMCEHSQRQAKSNGFRAMQYNLVVATNEGAIRLLKRHGFEVVGKLPNAFNHKRLGYVDALVMFKELV